MTTTATTKRELFLTIYEASDELRISERTMRQWIKDGVLRALKINRVIRIPTSKIHRLADGGCRDFRKAETSALDTIDA